MSCRAALPGEEVDAVNIVVIVGVALRVQGAGSESGAQFPAGEIGSVHVAVLVEVGREDGRDGQLAVGVEAGRVPLAAGERWQLDGREGAAEAAPIEDVELLTDLRIEAIDERNGERAAYAQARR